MSDLISRDEVLSLLPGGQSCDPQAIADAVRSLSTHQQQGDVKLIGRLRDIADALASECHPRSTVEAITEAADALSRAPQPDTVTELVKRDCLYKPCGYPTCKCVGIGIDARELTAALAARGRV